MQEQCFGDHPKVKIYKISQQTGLNYAKVQNLLQQCFSINAGKWADEIDELGFAVEWDGKDQYNVIGPVFGRGKEVIMPDSTPGWITVGFLHNHTEGEEAILSDFDRDEAQKIIAKTRTPLCMGIIGVDFMGEGVTMEMEWIEP